MVSIDIVRIVICSIIFIGILYILIPTVVNGLKTGKIRHSDGKKYCDRVKNPVGFWGVFIIDLGLIILIFYVWIKVII